CLKKEKLRKGEGDEEHADKDGAEEGADEPRAMPSVCAAHNAEYARPWWRKSSLPDGSDGTAEWRAGAQPQQLRTGGGGRPAAAEAHDGDVAAGESGRRGRHRWC